MTFATYLFSGILCHLLLPSYRHLPLPHFTSKKRVDYLTRVIAILHALLVTALAYYGIFHLCDDNKQSILSSRQCLTTPKLFHLLSAIITIGYLSFDLLATASFNHENNPLTYQTYMHHVAGIVAFATALVLRVQGSPFLIGAIANQFTEISTPFMNLRQILYVHKMENSVCATVNKIVFAFTFLVVRLLFQIYFAYVSLFWLLDEYPNLPGYSGWELLGFTICWVAQVLGLLLNFSWASLIVKQLMRMVGSNKHPRKKKGE
ncbi:hypothetical protein FGO68_gene15160 [Halteria grandinella]|uniref:TLC domain-containing protein n=1 Tax=Halteria grandinella TaxID=5974 RepID=A0A8J8SZG6_HALGN|nr:hypothetical protein FGO68_gene15160 [Halteria grandinella]